MNRKINALEWIDNYTSLEKRRTVMKIFIESHFNYCPLIWMFHSQTINNKVNHLHKRAIRIFYTHFKLSFEGLLRKNDSF